MSEADVRLAADAIHSRAAGRHLLLLCDFDGTLAEFNANPEAVWLSPARHGLLDAIGADGNATVAIVSGRRLEDVRQRTNLTAGVYYAGLHGLEIEGGGGRHDHPDLARTDALIAALAEPLSSELLTLGGSFLEHKEHSVVAHFRAASIEDGARAEAITLRHAKPHLDSGALRLMRGAFMLELLPNIDWDKGSAVKWILQRVVRQHHDAWPLYIGDDVTDEDAFNAVRGIGLSVAASARAGGADFAVDGPHEVESLLAAVASQLARV